jgi:hypothetical protein
MLIMGDVVGQKRHQDADLWSRVCAGDSRAFEDIYRAHADALFVFSLRRLGVFQDAEDVVARTFEELWKQRTRVQCDEQRGLRPWLYTVARRQCGRLSGQPHPVEQVTDFLVGPGVDVVVEDVMNERAAAALLTARWPPPRSLRTCPQVRSARGWACQRRRSAPAWLGSGSNWSGN